MRFRRLIILSLVLFIFILSGCSIFTKSKENKEVSMKLNNVKVSIDPRIELISIIIYLSPTYDSNVKSILPENTTYKTDVENYFRQYENHEVIKTFDSMFCTSYDYDAPPTTMIYLTNTPNLRIKNSINKDDLTFKSCMERAGGEDTFLKFVDQLNAFCEESNFYKFYNDHTDYYTSIVGTTVSNLSNTDYIAQVENYYGATQNS